jgi:hypothetical protein
LIENYHKRNWNFCFQAIEHLQGKWNGQVDSFYDILLARVQSLSQQQLDDQWDGVIDR